MKRILFFVLILTLSIASIAQTGQQAFDAWEFWKGKTKQGNPQCTLYAAVPLEINSKNHLQSIEIHHFGNENFIRVSIYKKDFLFTTDSKIPVTIDFNDGHPYKVIGTVDGKFIDFQISKDDVESFLSSIGRQSTMHFGVNADLEGEWTIPLKSVKKLMTTFNKCSMDGSKEQERVNGINAAKTCDQVHFTGIAAAKVTDLEEALKAKDLEDYVARYPILCNRNNFCKGVGWFTNQKGVNKGSTNDGVMWIEVPLDLTTGRREIFLITRNANVTCDK